MAAAKFFMRKKEQDKNKLLANHVGKMTPEIVRAICVANEGYETPELNDKLYLHFKAFTHIAGLEAYTAVKALWLESNAIEEIDNLSHMTDLSALFLHNNRISKMENLHKLSNLRTLNLSNNCITEIGGLECLTNLQTLNLSKNNIATKKAVEPVIGYASITNLDLGVNLLEDEAVLELFVKMPKLSALVLKGNRMVSDTRNYRKRMLNSMPDLVYLDDRPVFKEERLRAKAWQEGGPSAERKAREKLLNEKKAEATRHMKRFREWQKEQLAAIQARRAAGLPDPPPCVSYETAPDTDEDSEGEDDHIESNVYDFKAKSIYEDAKKAMLSSSRPSFKQRMAKQKEAAAKKKLEDAIQKARAAKAAAATETSTDKWTEETQMRLATLVRSKKFDFVAVAKSLAAEIKWPQLTADDCRLKWCSLDWEKYKKKCGLERSAAKKPPSNETASKSPEEPAKESANKTANKGPEIRAAESEDDSIETAPPVPPSGPAPAPASASASASASAAPVSLEPDLCFEETDMDELD